MIGGMLLYKAIGPASSPASRRRIMPAYAPWHMIAGWFKLAPCDANVPGSLNPYPHTTSLDADNQQSDVAANAQRLSWFSAEHKHPLVPSFLVDEKPRTAFGRNQKAQAVMLVLLVDQGRIGPIGRIGP
jgi:hypothetical protein